MPNQNPKLRIFLLAAACCAFFVVAGRAQAATYYIKPGGSATASCLDGGANACNFVRAHALAASGDTLIWKGGTYNLSDSWPRMMITKSITMKAAPGETPVISAATYAILGPDAPEDNDWGKLLQIAANNVTIDGLTIQDTGYRASKTDLDIQSNYAIYSYNRSNITVKNCNFKNMWHHAIALERGSGHLIENNRSEDSVNCFPDGACGGSWGATFHIIGTLNAVVRGNTIIRSYGESIHTINGASGTIIENNTIYDGYMNPIRIHSTKNDIVRNNLIYSTRIPAYSGSWDSGIGIGMERYRFTGPDGTIVYCNDYNFGHRIYGNRITGYRFGINISTAGEGGWDSEHDAGLTERNCKLSDVKIFNNTVAMTRHASLIPASLRISDNGRNRILSSVQFKNNLFWANTPGDAISADYSAPVTFDYNLWNKIPSVTYISTRGTHDPGYPTYPTLAISDYLTKSSGWDSITPGSLSADAFNIKPTAANAINRAGWLTTVSSLSGSGRNLAVADQFFSPGDLVQIQGKTVSSKVISVSGNSLVLENSLSWTQGNGISLAYSGSAPDIGASELGSVIAPVCGNLICESVETHASCPADCPNGTIIPRTNWTCTADSEETSAIDGSCENAFDNNISTAWHTSWTGTSPLQPHNIDINMGGAYQISGLRYIPRQVDGTNGIVTQYEIYISTDGTNWGSPIAQGTWSYQNKEAKDISFTSRTAQYLRFRSLDDNSHHWTSAAEIMLLSGTGDTTSPASPSGLSVR